MTNQRDRQDFPDMRQRRISMRKAATETERLLWHRLRNLEGVKFRRQHQIGSYIADFYSHEHKLVIEVDGSQHFEADALSYDAQRTAFMGALGIRVVRVTNAEVFGQMDAVLEAILAACTPSPQPSPRGRGRPASASRSD
jgi:very-short-patch-repair endonuclease